MSTCPVCLSRKFQVVVRQLADVTYDEDGNHEVHDVYGDVDFDDESHAICAECGWAGQLKELK
jgi:hypothetical protein